METRKPNYNGRKSNIISVLKRKNMRLAQSIIDMDKRHLTSEQADMLMKLANNVRRCACPSLYGQSIDSKQTRYVGSVRCDSKNCFVCNYARQKSVRRKYWAWFSGNRQVVAVKPGKRVKYVTKAQYEAKFSDCKVLAMPEYDLMHLTLTVPHFAGTGFRGEKYYFETLAKLYDRLRNKCDYFHDHVLGGEYGIECSHPENLHIHIHSLLMVKRERQSRNKLHYELLREWNRITVNPEVKRNKIALRDYDSVKAGNTLIDDDYVRALDPKGATIIGLETIFTTNPETGQKVRSFEWNNKAMLRAVMETISYHFSPTAFEKENRTFNLDMLAELQPVLYRKQLYRKFGCLHGEKSLNVRLDAAEDEDEFDRQIYVDEANGDVVDTETGEVIDKVEQFFVSSPAYVYHDPGADYKIYMSREGKQKRQWMEARTTGAAVAELRRMVREKYKYAKHRGKQYKPIINQ